MPAMPLARLCLSLILERSLPPSPPALIRPRDPALEFLGKLLTEMPRPLPTAGNGHFMFLVRGGGRSTGMMHQGRYAGKDYLKFYKNVTDYFMTS